MWYACDPEILTEILPVIVIVLLCRGGAFGLTGMGAPPANLHSIPFILNVDRLGFTLNRHIKLQLFFAVESIGVDGIR